MSEINKTKTKNCTSIIFLLIMFIFLETGIAFVSKDRILIFIIFILSTIQIAIGIIIFIKKFRKSNYYRNIGLLGIFNSIVFSIIASFLIGHTRVDTLLIFVFLIVISFFEIVVFEMLTRKNKINKKIYIKNKNQEKYTNKLVCILIVIIYLIIKIFEINFLLILKILCIFISFLLMFFYFGIIASKNQSK